jgi:arylsulfatase A-like enzyme
LLTKLDDLGVTDNTIVVFTTDNGAEVMTWPDGGNTPFRGEKATNWEGGFRVPTVIRWPGTIKAGSIYNDIFSHYDLLPTFAAAAGDADIVAKCLRGAQIGSKTFKVHLDGVNLMPFFKGETEEAPRKGFLYWNDDGALIAIRVQNWKIDFKEQNHKGAGVWKYEFTNLRAPELFNLRSDPFERGDESMLYNKWGLDRVFIIVPAQALVTQWIKSFAEFPPRQKPASYNLDEVIQKMEKIGTSTN